MLLADVICKLFFLRRAVHSRIDDNAFICLIAKYVGVFLERIENKPFYFDHAEKYKLRGKNKALDVNQNVLPTDSCLLLSELYSLVEQIWCEFCFNLAF